MTWHELLVVVGPLIALVGWAIKRSLNHACDQLDKEREARSKELAAERASREADFQAMRTALIEHTNKAAAEHGQMLESLHTICVKLNGDNDRQTARRAQ